MDRSNGNNGNHDSVAVVTGSSRGIGKAIAREFVQNGYCVVLNSRDEEDLNRAAQDIAKDQRIHYIAGDVSQENICRLSIQAAIKKFGKLDVLVNNAGIGGESKKINEISTSDWSYVIDVNLKGAFLCTREELHNSDIADSNAKNYYSIINTSSVHESIPQPDAAHYAASKGRVFRTCLTHGRQADLFVWQKQRSRKITRHALQ